MQRPECLTCYPFGRYKVIGETPCYWKIRHNNNRIGYVSKRTLKSRGKNIQYYAWTKETGGEYVYCLQDRLAKENKGNKK